MTETQIVPEITRKLSSAYNQTQQILSESPDMTSQVWNDALETLKQIDFGATPSRDTFVKAHAATSVLEQVLVAVAARAGGGNGFQF